MTFFFSMLFVVLVFWRPQEWLVPWLFGWPLLYGVVGMAAIAFLVELQEKRARIPRSAVLLLLAGLFFATLMSHVAHFYLTATVTTFEDTWKFIFFTALLFCVLDRPSRLRWLARVFVVMACVMSIHALLQDQRGYGFAWQYPIWHSRPGVEPYLRTHFFGIFDDPNDLAQILATSIPLVFASFRRRGGFTLLVEILAVALLLAAIETTHSRGGMVALAATVTAMAVLLLPPRRIPAVAAVLVVASLVLMPVLAGTLDVSAHDRVDFWGQANAAFKGSPLFGVGYGRFDEYVAESRAAHNAFVLCYTELGLFGYWFWISLLVVGIVGAWRARIALNSAKTVDEVYMRKFSGMAIAAMLSFLASGYFLSRTYVYPLFFLIAMLSAVPPAARSLLPENYPPLTDFRRDAFVYGTIATVGSMVYIYISIVVLNRLFYG